MKSVNFSEKPAYSKLLAFFLPFLGMVAVMIFSGYTPFGDYSMLYSDMYHQYFPFFKGFRAALLSGDSMLYVWDMGMGMDYLGLISYYLASPLNLLSVLVPESWLLPYFSFLVPLKLGFASLFFTIFLQKLFGKKDLSSALFGCFYGLCAWALGYQWNVMWLDTFALMPLVILGMVSLLRERKFLLYAFTLFLSVAANYYIGFFTCIFVLLCFICYEICCQKSFRRFLADLGWMAVVSAIAIAMTAFLELPALAALQSTQSSVNKFPHGFRLNIADENTWLGLITAMTQVAGQVCGGLAPTFKEGLPNLYCGVFTTLLSLLFLMNRKIRLREKLCACGLLLFFNLSFVIRQLDYIWHGFHFTNMIPYRFSFLYSFVMLYMAYRAFRLRNSYASWQILLSAVLALGFILCSKVVGQSYVLWGYNVFFILVYTGLTLFATFRKKVPQEDPEARASYYGELKNRRRVGTVALSAVMALELAINIVCFAVNFPGTYVGNYPRGTKDAAKVIEYMKEREQDNLFYRAESTHSQTLNDGALNRYHGISAFTSSANVKVTEFMKALGYGAKNTYNRYCFEESSPVANLFLGLKYMIERDGNVEDNVYFDDVYSSGKVHLLENNAYLPLGFMANSQLLNVDFKTATNPFLFQNQLFSAATGVQHPVWELVSGKNLVVSSDDVTITSENQPNSCTYESDKTKDGKVLFSFTMDKSGFLCIHLDLNQRNNYTVSKNGQQLYSESYSLPQMIAVSDVVPGDVIEISLKCTAGKKGTIRIQPAIVNEEVFRQGQQLLAAEPLELTHFSNTLVEGTVNCSRDGLLYTSIPQNGNWSVYVDGQEATVSLVGDVMVGVLLPQGSHQITLRYENPAFSLGWKISVISLVLLAALYVVVYRPRAYHGKYSAKK